MKKIKPQKILAGGILSLSLLLTAASGYAKDPAYSVAPPPPPPESSSTVTTTTITSSPTMASTATSSSVPKPEETLTMTTASSTTSGYSTTALPPKPESGEKPSSGGGTGEVSMAGSGTITSEPTRVTPAATVTEDSSSSTVSPFSYLSFTCLRGFEASELEQACRSIVDCGTTITPKDSLGNSYFYMKVYIASSECTPEKDGVVEAIDGDPSTEADPKVVCAYTKGLCHE